jgi:hypothetical protein
MSSYGKKSLLHPTSTHIISLPKTLLMLSRTMLNRLIIFGFMVLVGFSLAKSIQAGSTIAIILSIVSLSAGVYFLYLLTKAQQQMEAEESA